MRISDWSSDVCSSDLISQVATRAKTLFMQTGCNSDELRGKNCSRYMFHLEACNTMYVRTIRQALLRDGMVKGKRSEEHTSELQSLMRISYAVFCLKKKKKQASGITNHKNINETI